jgi:Zn ribbon nucleic-acid-binding protein
MTELNRTVVTCPKCRRRKAHLTPANTEQAVLVFECTECGFQWVTMRPSSAGPEGFARNDAREADGVSPAEGRQSGDLTRTDGPVFANCPDLN